MPIKLEQLKRQLNAEQFSFMITGDEPLLMMEAGDSIRAFLRQQGFTERSVFDIGRNFDFNDVSQESDNFSLFAEKKIIELRFEKLPDKAQQDALKELLETPNDDCRYLIRCPKMDKRKLSTKWVKSIEANGLVVQIWPVAGYQLNGWLSDRAAQLGLTLTGDAVQMLADRSEGNLLAANQDLQKLQLLSSEQPVDVEQVMSSVANNARYSVFELLDTALAGKADKVQKMIQQLQQEGVVPIILVATLYREVRQMVKMSEQMATGRSASDVVKEYRVWSSRSRLVTNALNKLPLRVWLRILARCGHLDKMSKGQAEGNVWDELMTCLLLMGGKLLWRKVI